MQNLIKGFLERLGNASTTTGGMTQKDLHIAAALLLIEVGHADSEWTREETETIIERITALFGLDAAEARELFAEARHLDQQHVSLHPTLKTINSHFDAEQKAAILTDCWRVAYADGVLDHYEEHQIRRIAELLYLPHSTFIQAKLQAQEEMQRARQDQNV